jgi:predicted AlkP superfamily pyrophosphatase or phosphodiesterase
MICLSHVLILHRRHDLQAISNTTKVLASLVDLLDNDTTLVVTSDHGHIDRGGHGGACIFLSRLASRGECVRV